MTHTFEVQFMNKTTGKWHQLETFETEKKAEAGKEAATKRVSKLAEQFPDWEPRFKKGQKVKFTPFRENKELTGEILSSYPYKPKKGELREDVRIKAGEKIYVKNGNEIKLVK